MPTTNEPNKPYPLPGNSICASKPAAQPINMGNIPQISTDNGGALKNVGNQIRFFYDNNLSLTGWAVTKDWVYPKSLNGLTVKDFGIITPTSAWEISDQPTGNLRNKILVYFVSDNITKDVCFE